MIRPIMRDEAFLAQKAEPATPEDRTVAADLLETLIANKAGYKFKNALIQPLIAGLAQQTEEKV